MIDAKLAADILRSQGPMALALIAVVLLLFAESAAFIAFVRYMASHISEKTVPLSVHMQICDLATEGIQELKTLIVARGGAPR